MYAALNHPTHTFVGMLREAVDDIQVRPASDGCKIHGSSSSGRQNRGQGGESMGTSTYPSYPTLEAEGGRRKFEAGEEGPSRAGCTSYGGWRTL